MIEFDAVLTLMRVWRILSAEGHQCADDLAALLATRPTDDLLAASEILALRNQEKQNNG